MTADARIGTLDVLEINPVYLFRWEESLQAHVLLYPEGIVRLNETAGEILDLCTGDRTVGRIIGELQRRYAGKNVADGAHKFLEASRAKGWIRVKA